MKLPSIIEKTDTLVVLFGLSFVVFGWFALSLTLASLFLFPLLSVGMALTGALALFTLGKLLARAPNDLRFVIIVALLYATYIGVVSEPTLFSGRDQGSIAEAAFRLAHNSELAFATPASDSFFQIYGPGTALNFPGFAYTKEGYLLTQFPLGYTAWLASFVALFGLAGYAIGNALLLFLFLLSLYALLRLFVHPFYALAGFGLALFSFLPSWFAKFTLTENFGVFLFTFLAFNIILFFKEEKFLSYAAVLLTATLFAFTRIEGFAFLFLALILLLLHPKARALIKAKPWKHALIPGAVFIFFFLRDFFINLPYYIMIGKALLKFVHGTAGSSAVANTSSLPLAAVFFLYGFLLLFLVGLFGLIVFIKEKRYLFLLPAFLTLPVFLYLFQPNISLDHPWMLRRYLFSLYPALLVSAVLCLALLLSKGRTLPLEPPTGKKLFLATIIFSGLLFLQLPAWSTALPYAENRGLLKQVETFASDFSDHDLILVDRMATGNGFSMLSGPMQFLYGKNAVYFFNPYDLDALDTHAFDHVYLLVPDEMEGRYAALFGKRLILKKPISFSLSQFENVSLHGIDAFRLPAKTTITTHDLLFQLSPPAL